MAHNLGPFETILFAELRLGLSPLFYTRLLDIDDHWSFVLKLHALFEGTLTKLIEEKLKIRSNCRECMTPRDSFVSRVHLAERMAIVEPDYRAFLLALNRLRNDITHNIRFIAFDLADYVDSLADLEFRRTAMALCAGFKNVTVEQFAAMFQEPKQSSRASTPDREFGKRLRESQQQRKTRPARDVRTVRELFWHQDPKLSLWYAGVCTLDLFSLQFVFEGNCEAGFRLLEQNIEAKVQDLLLDPNVLAYKRKINNLWNNEV